MFPNISVKPYFARGIIGPVGEMVAAAKWRIFTAHVHFQIREEVDFLQEENVEVWLFQKDRTDQMFRIERVATHILGHERNETSDGSSDGRVDECFVGSGHQRRLLKACDRVADEEVGDEFDLLRGAVQPSAVPDTLRDGRVVLHVFIDSFRQTDNRKISEFVANGHGVIVEDAHARHVTGSRVVGENDQLVVLEKERDECTYERNSMNF